MIDSISDVFLFLAFAAGVSVAAHYAGAWWGRKLRERSDDDDGC